MPKRPNFFPARSPKNQSASAKMALAKKAVVPKNVTPQTQPKLPQTPKVQPIVQTPLTPVAVDNVQSCCDTKEECSTCNALKDVEERYKGPSVEKIVSSIEENIEKTKVETLRKISARNVQKIDSKKEVFVKSLSIKPMKELSQDVIVSMDIKDESIEVASSEVTPTEVTPIPAETTPTETSSSSGIVPTEEKEQDSATEDKGIFSHILQHVTDKIQHNSTPAISG